MRYTITALFLLLYTLAGAHPMPATQMLLDVREGGIGGELRLPLNELQLALGDSHDVTAHPETLVRRDSSWLAAYVLRHLHPVGEGGKEWTVRILSMQVTQTEQRETGRFRQLRIGLWMQPPPGESSRSLSLHYDAIMHQLVTHKALVSIRQDWAAGQIDTEVEVGVIAPSTSDYSVAPLTIHLDEGSSWRGFTGMFRLGLAHIAEGTDHLLFLLVLLLPAPLIAKAGRWAAPGTTRYALLRLLKITAAFTIGHSLTLLSGAAGWLRLPQQPIEVMIAVSILVTAVHAIRPIFPGKEMLVAAGFGLVHGLAFATVLSELHLSGGQLALSILGFNLGIEAMQVFAILLVVPWLIVLSGNMAWYRVLRVGGAAVAGIAAAGWIVERVSGKGNAISRSVSAVAAHEKWLLPGIALIAVAGHFVRRGQARQ